jgi:hypothetical protein
MGQIGDIRSDQRWIVTRHDLILCLTDWSNNRKLFDASYTDCNDITWCDDCCNLFAENSKLNY